MALGQADALDRLPGLTGVRGRMELAARLPNGAAVYVDYAHTPDALERLLTALRPHTAGRLLVVFGAGGDRDRGKRPLMGQAAARLADLAIVTDDNPRSEDPASIRSASWRRARRALDIGDRAQAIAEGLEALRPGDVLAVAGKGHEQGQTIGEMVVPFDDVGVVRRRASDRRATGLGLWLPPPEGRAGGGGNGPQVPADVPPPHLPEGGGRSPCRHDRRAMDRARPGRGDRRHDDCAVRCHGCVDRHPHPGRPATCSSRCWARMATGTRFVADALAKGAAGAMVHQDVPGAADLLRVDDTLAALTRLGGYARARFAGRVVAVTGSVGKTTTKEMLRASSRRWGRRMPPSPPTTTTGACR